MKTLMALLLVPVCAFAQTSVPMEFPADAVTISGDALKARLSGKVFSVKTADGTTWRLEFKSNGYSFIDVSSGFRDQGSWRVEASLICNEWKKAAHSCSEARLKGETLYIKRTRNGEIVAFEE